MTTTEIDDLRTAFIDTAAKLATKELLPRAVALDKVQPDLPGSDELCKVLREAGLIDMSAAESAGGMALDAASVGAVLARLAQACAGSALLAWAHESSHLLLAAAGVEANVSEGNSPLDRLIANATVCTHSLAATRESGHWVVDGSAEFVWGLGVAGNVLIAARTPEGGLIAVVGASNQRIRIREQHVRIGARACPSAAIELRGLVLADDDVQLIEGAAYTRLLAESRAQALALIGAIACGNARGALRRAVEYARERYQGGDFIIEHSLVRNMLGKSLAELRAAEALVDTALTRGGDDHILAKVIATRHGEQICLDAVQVFGGNGYMRDYGVEKHLRDAKMLCLIGGNNDRLLQALVDTHKHEGDWP